MFYGIFNPLSTREEKTKTGISWGRYDAGTYARKELRKKKFYPLDTPA